MIILNPMASVLTPLKGANKQDWHLYNNSKAYLIEALPRSLGIKTSQIDLAMSEMKA